MIANHPEIQSSSCNRIHSPLKGEKQGPGVDDLLLAADNREGGEAGVGAELATPAGGDGEGAALGRAAVGLGGTLGLDNVLAGGGGTAAGVDTEVPGAGGVGLVADAVEALDGPLGSGGHHGDGVGSGRSSDSAGGGDESNESGGELHVDGLGLLVVREGCFVCIVEVWCRSGRVRSPRHVTAVGQVGQLMAFKLQGASPKFWGPD
ncbi:hypothetical protein HG530_012316 [Fusarium avenaceum]|nr:hypothetical protein HG530_012316 [Fusarium avenaceum]